MGNIQANISADGQLSARLIRADGSHRDMDLSKSRLDVTAMLKKLKKPLGFYQKLYHKLRQGNALPIGMTLTGFLYCLHSGDATPGLMALVTTAGVNYLAQDFNNAASSADISLFNYHDSGTGNTAAAIGDTTLQTQAGPATRATGTQSNPVSGQYRSVGTIAYVSTLAITEWGLFNQAAQGGTLWDHRIFSAINVVSGDSIQFTYTLTVNAGGS